MHFVQKQRCIRSFVHQFQRSRDQFYSTVLSLVFDAYIIVLTWISFIKILEAARNEAESVSHAVMCCRAKDRRSRPVTYGWNVMITAGKMSVTLQKGGESSNFR